MYTTSEAVTQRREVRALLDVRAGERVLDIGVGPGFLASELSAMGVEVVGLDVSEAVLALARRRFTVDGVVVELVVGDCTALPFPNGTFDAVVAVQVLEFVDDVGAALRESARVLRAGGRLLVVDTDIDSRVWPAHDQDRAARVLTVWNGHAPHPHLPRDLPRLLQEAGLTVVKQRTLTLAGDGSDPGTFGYRLADLVADYVVAHGIAADEAGAWLDDLRSPPDAWMSLDRSLCLATS
jgi:arsenite methyltransferase